MVDLNYKYNARDLALELAWFQKVVETRYQLHHGEPACSFADIRDVPLPRFNGRPSLYRRALERLNPSWEERLVLILALAPHVQPHLLNGLLGSIHPEFRQRPGNGSVVLPTVETALFLLAGNDLEKRFHCQRILEPDGLLFRERLLDLDQEGSEFCRTAARLVVDREFHSLFTSGREFQPGYSHAFPAKQIHTARSWDELVLPAKTKDQLEEVLAWVRYGDTLLHDWDMSRTLAPGYTCLFHGPPGTGKTMTAALLGNSSGLPVFRIDLAMVVSKYVGETEKNLRRIFDTAENRRWILFFDEAEALFGKRTEIQDAHDRFANQEVAYLLHRIEDYPGVVILATNMKSSLDEAFVRRFQNMVHFPLPAPPERLQIWKNAFSRKSALEKAVNLEKIAERYELSGGSIMNVVRYASLMALRAEGNVIRLKDVLQGIQREYSNQGKSI